MPDVKKEVKGLLQNPDCANFTEKVINRVAKDTGVAFTSDYIPDLFASVEIDFTDQGSIAGKHIAAKIYPRDAKTGTYKLGLSPKNGAGFTESGIRNIKYDYVESYLHELIHAAGANRRYNDQEVAQAIVNLVKDGDLTLSKSALGQFNSIKPGDVAAYSAWFDTALQHYCPGLGGERTRGDFPK